MISCCTAYQVIFLLPLLLPFFPILNASTLTLYSTHRTTHLPVPLYSSKTPNLGSELLNHTMCTTAVCEISTICSVIGTFSPFPHCLPSFSPFPLPPSLSFIHVQNADDMLYSLEPPLNNSLPSA
ncbi:hypothetical protein BDQ17DRAFT_1369955 [Cyathus striatus]|nr:hypothetical protein BDQ17DRAFT_1369955 [Cyathus striatus]